MKNLILINLVALTFLGCQRDSSNSTASNVTIDSVYVDYSPTTLVDFQKKHASYEKVGMVMIFDSQIAENSIILSQNRYTVVYTKIIMGSIYRLNISRNLVTNTEVVRVDKANPAYFAETFNYYKKGNSYLLSSNESVSYKNTRLYNFIDADHFTSKFKLVSADKTNIEETEMTASLISELTKYAPYYKNVSFCDWTLREMKCQENQNMSWLLE